MGFVDEEGVQDLRAEVAELRDRLRGLEDRVERLGRGTG